MKLLSTIMPYLLDGVKITILVSAIALVASMLLGMGLTLLLRIGQKAVKRIIGGYIKLFRNSPFMIQVYLAYNIPSAFGIHPKAIVIGTVILILYESAYMTVIYNMGFDAIPKGQEEAAEAFNFSYFDRVRRILLPQVFKVIIPTLTNQLILIIKDSSLLSVITVAELSMAATKCASLTYLPFEVYIIAGIMYWLLNLIIEFVTGIFRRKYLIF